MRFKYIILQAIFMVLLWAGENETVAKQLEQLQQQLKEVESKLKAVPQAKAKIKKF